MSRRTGVRLATITAALLAACGGSFTYRLPTPVHEARATFMPLGACASARGLESYQHDDAINVRFQPGVYIQYMIQGPSYNMVIVFGSILSDQEREKIAREAKATGDALYACATRPAAAPGAGASVEPG